MVGSINRRVRNHLGIKLPSKNQGKAETPVKGQACSGTWVPPKNLLGAVQAHFFLSLNSVLHKQRQKNAGVCQLSIVGNHATLASAIVVF